ncbi:MAG: DNA polymerase domain-containing protein, partial [Candidatus Binatia bacterium]
MADRGFVLTPTYRVIGGRPQVHLYAVLETGEPALVVDTRLRPYFFIRRVDRTKARPTLGDRVGVETALTAFDGAPVDRVDVDAPADVPELRRRLMAAGVRTFEADVRFAYRYLIDRGIRGAFSVAGAFERRPGVGRVYQNPEIGPADWVPSLRVLSFDIETSLDGERLFSIAVSGTGGDRVFIVGQSVVVGAEVVPDERSLLVRFLAHVREADPDVLTGWSVVEFDLSVLQRHARRLGLRLALGRNDEELDIQRDQSFTREPRATVCGRVVLDGLALLRSSYIRLEDYRLDTAAQALLGKRKLIAGEHRGAEIEAAYRDDPAKLAAYNLVDAQLVLEILATTKLIDLTVQRSRMTGMQLDRVSAQIAAIDSLYLGALRARGRVAPSVGAGGDATGGISGGLVLDSRPGLYRNILVFDFKSLYPSLVRTFNIDPFTYVPGGAGAVLRTPSGACFRAGEVGILPALVAQLWDERARARAAGDAVGAQATKILMNSMFGVLGSPASRLFAPAVANAITTAGQHVIRLAVAAVQALGHRVIYGDTDSLFVDIGEADVGRAEVAGETLRAAIGTAVGAALTREFGCTSYLE